MNRWLRWSWLAIWLSGCTVGPDYVRPNVPAPSKWSEAQPGVREVARQYARWWTSFEDPVLNRLIADATASNLDLQQARERIREARAQRTIAIAAGLPSLSARNNVSRRLNNFSSSTGTAATPFVGGAFGVGDQVIDIFQMGFDAQWEIDLFGGIRRSVEAADANLEAEIENSRMVLVTLLGEVARNYIELRGAQQLIAVTRENLRNQEDTLKLTEVRQTAGLASQLEVAQQASQVATTRSQLPAYQAAEKLAIHALSVLLGKQPGKLTPWLQRPGSIPESTNLAEADLPSELLRRRPDIRRAERQLAAASAQIGVATAELYPKFNLAAFIGLQNTDISDFTALGKAWSMGSTLTTPIFNWGKLQANISSKQAQHEQMLLAYQAVVLNAFKEVEDGLVAYQHEQTRRTSLAEAVEASRLAVALANERYHKGMAAFLDVLVSERSLYQAQASLVESDAAVSAKLVAVYKALGGGWQVE